MRFASRLLWLAVAFLGGFCFLAIASPSGSAPPSAAHLVVAAVCIYAIAYRFYSGFIARTVLALDPRRETPAVRRNDGKDYIPTNRWVVFGHHFAAIAGPGPLIGPVLAAQFGYLPGALWILAGVVLGGAVQDFVILVLSMRRDGRSLARLAREALGPAGAAAGVLAILLIMVILIAVLGVVIVNTLAESPWGLFSVACTIPIALVMGVIMRGGHGREVVVATALGLVALAAALRGGHAVSVDPAWGPAFTRTKLELAGGVIAYGLAASTLPIWLLLAPRDYLSTFVKLGTILALAVGICAVRPALLLPAVTSFASGGDGPIFAGKVFPFCFITIACGAISGFHALVASGTTPRLLERETDARMIGYGGMLLESFVAIMALIAAAALPPGEYLAINAPATVSLDWITARGFPVTPDQMAALAARVGEKTLMARSGGAPCLAVGMAEIFHRFAGGEAVAAVWYHFAIMFEALFILTTLDAGTRVGRFLLQDGLARLFPSLEGGSLRANLVTSAAFVAAWGWFVVMGAIDPAGGVKALWPLFGIANQLLAATALTIGATLLFRTGRGRHAWICIVPLAWLLAVCVTGGVEIVFSHAAPVGFIDKASAIADAAAKAGAWTLQQRTDWLNAWIDAVLACVFMALVLVVVASAARRWRMILRGEELAESDEVAASGAFGEMPPGPAGQRCCC